MNKVAIIDADSLCYRHTEKDSLQEAIGKVDNIIQNIIKTTEADFLILIISEGKYFRHCIDKAYKSNRKYTLPWIKAIKEYLKITYNASSSSLLEADDVVRYLYESPDIIIDNPEKILVATDKDLLKSIPGTHLNYNKKLGDNLWGNEWVTVSKENAEKYEWTAMISGDTADGIKGLKGKGPAWCEKHFSNKSIEHIRLIVFNEYIKEYGESIGITKFYKNYKLLHILCSLEEIITEIGVRELNWLPYKVNKPQIDDLTFNL